MRDDVMAIQDELTQIEDRKAELKAAMTKALELRRATALEQIKDLIACYDLDPAVVVAAISPPKRTRTRKPKAVEPVTPEPMDTGWPDAVEETASDKAETVAQAA